VVLDSSGNAELVQGAGPEIAGAAAWGSFQDAINETGWALLDIHTSPEFSGASQSYAAGFLEGSLTHHRIYQHRGNVWGFDFFTKTKIPKTVLNFLDANLAWMKEQVRLHQSDAYWQTIGYLLEQARGLTDGYNIQVKAHPERTFLTEQMLTLSLIDADMDDVVTALLLHGHNVNEYYPLHNRRKARRRRHYGHCSALIQCAPGNSDIWVGHSTWDGYRAMLRVVKNVDMPLPGVSARKLSFTSNPGSLYSADDFYVTDTGLAVIETSISNHNNSLWMMIKPESVFTWARTMVANRLARTGAEWTELQVRHNSGTCNNQWMVVDYKVFVPGQPLKDGTLWVSETMPGYSHREDMTHVLAQRRSWPSYNVPFFNDIWTVGGYPAMQSWHPKVADTYSLTKNPRALMFERADAAGKVTSLKSFMDLLRSNDLEDPLSQGDACNAISARCDLNRPSTKQYECFGGIDLKVTGWRHDISDLSFLGVSGPTQRIDIPAFAWSNQNSSVDGCMASQHTGHPDKFDFDMYMFSNKAARASRDAERQRVDSGILMEFPMRATDIPSTALPSRLIGNWLNLWAYLCTTLTVCMVLILCRYSEDRLRSGERGNTALHYVAIGE